MIGLVTGNVGQTVKDLGCQMEGFGLCPMGSGMEDGLPGGFRSITASVQTLDWRMGVAEGRSLTGGA